jgi:hypothetical protein
MERNYMHRQKILGPKVLQAAGALVDSRFAESRFAESRFAESRFAECRRRTSNFDVGLLAYRKTSNKRPRHLFVQICLSSRRLMETGV